MPSAAVAARAYLSNALLVKLKSLSLRQVGVPETVKHREHKVRACRSKSISHSPRVEYQ